MNDDALYPAPHAPMPVAERLKQDVFSPHGFPEILFWRGQWWQYNGKSWELVDELDIEGPIWRHLGRCFYQGKENLRPWSPTPGKVSNVLKPLAIISRPVSRQFEAPAWLDDGEHPDAKHLIALDNGVLNFRSGEFIPQHTPRLFNTWHLPFAYDAQASCPNFDAFLESIFDHDPHGQLALQEYAGYLISGRTDLQKALILIGPARGGKGTLSRTLQQLVGLSNVVSPSLGDIGNDFGLANLIGKQVAVIEDARNDYGRNNAVTVERLLSIIGEDAVAINRKNKEYWHGTLSTRFLIVSNEVPRFGDASGAVLSRFIPIRLKKSFKKNPDTGLGKRINQELPGIFNWALEGLARLETQGHFTQPATMADVIDLMSDLNSPVANFLDECTAYEITGDAEDWILLKDIHGDYKQWCEGVGGQAMKQPNFAQALAACDARLEYKNTAVGEHPKARRIFGVREVINPHAWQISKQSA